MISEPGNNDLIHTNNNCTGCNRCIKVFSVPGANISFTDPEDGLAHIRVNGDWCIKCGACLDACEHEARVYEDDTDRFFRDLKCGKPITLLIAPSFKANYPEDYERIIGGLKALGIRHVISVSFGADISLWAFLKYIREHEFYGSITNPCPVVVDYIEKYEPELIPSLCPVQTPLMCTAIYARKQLGLTEDFAFLSPCIAKKVEIERAANKGLVNYNVTYEHFMTYVRAHNIYGDPYSDELDYDLGTIYPMPGGLTEYAHWLTGEDLFARQIEGEKYIYDYLRENAQRIIDGKTPFAFIDALNCQKGCLCGTAVEHRKNKAEDALYQLAGIRQAVKRDSALTKLKPADRLKVLEDRFCDIDINDYLISYEDKSRSFTLSEPGEEDLEAIFLDMDKTTEESRMRNCAACGYHSCREMATAIYNGLNRKENCVYYLKNSIKKQYQQLRYMAEHDELLNIYNRRTIMERVSELPPDTDYSIILADINGFRGLNETYGQKEVDKILFQLSDALKEKTAVYNGIVGRLKSDEFIILYIGKKLDESSPEIRPPASSKN